MNPQDTLARLEMLMAAGFAHFSAWQNSKKGNIEAVFVHGLAWTPLSPDGIKALQGCTYDNADIKPEEHAGTHTFCDDLKLETYFDEAIHLVSHLDEPVTRQEQDDWMAWMTRWLYGAEHRLAQVQSGLGTPAKEYQLREWRSWARRQYRARLDLSQDADDYAVSTGPAELLEMALFRGPLREVAQNPFWRVAWAASALQEQNLLIFEAFGPDRELMNSILADARPLIIEDWSDYADNKEYFFSKEDWEQYSSDIHNSTQAAEVLWLEWVGASDIKSHTLLAMIGAGIPPYGQTKGGKSWFHLAKNQSVFDALAERLDPLGNHHPWQRRLNAFKSLGPSTIHWENHTLVTSGNEELPWLLRYAKKQWNTWNEEEKALAVECWQAQAISGLSQSGSIVLTESQLHSPSKALDAIQKWQSNTWSEDQAGQLYLEFISGDKALPRWVDEQGNVSAFTPTFCAFSLTQTTKKHAHKNDTLCLLLHPTPEEVQPASPIHIDIPERYARFLFSLGATDVLMATSMRAPLPGFEEGGALGETLLKALQKLSSKSPPFTELPFLIESAAGNLLSLRTFGPDVFTPEAWKGLDPFLPEIQSLLMKKEIISLSYLTHWVKVQDLSYNQETLQSRVLLRYLSLNSSVNILHLTKNIFIQRLQTLWEVHPDLGPNDVDESMEGVWHQACGKHCSLESAWRGACLKRTLPRNHSDISSKNSRL